MCTTINRFSSRLGFVFFFSIFSLPLSAQPASSSSDTPTTYVFVHGAWGGSWDWQDVATRLRAAGHAAYRPSLTGLGERVHLARPDINLDTHIQDVVNALRFEDLTDVVLVGHSYGGMVITGVAERAPERIAHLVYVDAFLPEDGESVADLLSYLGPPFEPLVKQALTEFASGTRWRLALPEEIAHPKDVAHPLATFVQPVPRENPNAAALPGTYILATEPGAERDNFGAFAERARDRGWPIHELPTGHTPQRSMPQELVDILLAL